MPLEEAFRIFKILVDSFTARLVAFPDVRRAIIENDQIGFPLHAF